MYVTMKILAKLYLSSELYSVKVGEATLSISYENTHEVNLFHWKYLDFLSITPLDLTLEFLNEPGRK